MLRQQPIAGLDCAGSRKFLTNMDEKQSVNVPIMSLLVYSDTNIEANINVIFICVVVLCAKCQG